MELLTMNLEENILMTKGKRYSEEINIFIYHGIESNVMI